MVEDTVEGRWWRDVGGGTSVEDMVEDTMEDTAEYTVEPIAVNDSVIMPEDLQDDPERLAFLQYSAAVKQWCSALTKGASTNF